MGQRHEKTINDMIEFWEDCGLPVHERLFQALRLIEDMHEERLRLQHRIHCQRRAFRDNWEIYEQRGNFIGSPAARRAYANLLKKYKELKYGPERETQVNSGHAS